MIRYCAEVDGADLSLKENIYGKKQPNYYNQNAGLKGRIFLLAILIKHKPIEK